MEGLVVTVLVVVIVVWYFGATLNKLVAKADVILDGSSEMATDEFSSFRKDQKIRLHKTRIKQSKVLDELSDDKCYSDDEFNSIFNVMKSHDEKSEEK